MTKNYVKYSIMVLIGILITSPFTLLMQNDDFPKVELIEEKIKSKLTRIGEPLYNSSFQYINSFDIQGGAYCIAIDPITGNFFIYFPWRFIVRVYDSDFTSIGTIGVENNNGSDNAHFSEPGWGSSYAGIAVNKYGQLFVSDNGNQRVQVFNTADLSYNGTINCSSLIGNCPFGLDVTENGSLYLSMYCGDVYIFNTSLQQTGVVTMSGGYSGNVHSAAVTSKDLVYVGHGNSDYIDVYNSTINTWVHTMDSNHTTAFERPVVVRKDSKDNLYVICDTTQPMLFAYNSNEELIGTITNASDPIDVAIRNDYVYLLDEDWNQVRVFHLVYYDTLVINGNNDLLSQAEEMGWKGNGSETNPIIIDGLWIQNASFNLIAISDTDFYFEISDCHLNAMTGLHDGILLDNVTHGLLFNNIIEGASYGIHLDGSNLTTIENNIVRNNSYAGIYSYQSSNCSITWNSITNNSWDGTYRAAIFLDCSPYFEITDNYIAYDFTCGIHVYGSLFSDILRNDFEYNKKGIYFYSYSNNSYVAENHFYEGSDNAITTFFVDNITITQNTFEYGQKALFLGQSSINVEVFENNMSYGIGNALQFDECDYISVYQNIIRNYSQNGIYVDDSDNITILENTIECNAGTAINFCGTSDNSVVERNKFISNGATPQVYDNDAVNGNTFNYNYWDDWTSPDDDGDGIVDNPYVLHANNHDPNPLAYPEMLQYQFHDPIFINGNVDLLDQAANEEWTGDGSENYPIIIEGYWIVDATTTDALIFVQNTNLWISITGNFLDSVDKSGDGIYLFNSSNCDVSDNAIYRTRTGIFFHEATENSIMNNVIPGCTLCAVNLTSCSNNNVSNNFLQNCDFSAIILYNSSYNNISENDIGFNEGLGGIYLAAYGPGNSILANKIYNSSFGIYLYGIGNTSISYNLLTNNTDYGIYLSGADYNEIKWNDFIGNNAGGKQGYDGSAMGSTVEHNYWDDWTSPDSEPDGIVDNPYVFDGGCSQDIYPKTTPNICHFLSNPTITYPNGGEKLNGTIPISWMNAIDSFGHAVYYTIYYSPDAGMNWYILDSDITEVFYDWNTSTVIDGNNYLVKVEASCSEGLMASDDSDNVFTIFNLAHSLSIPTINNPKSGDFLDGLVEVAWTNATDSYNHTVSYELIHSTDKIIWTSFANHLTTTTFIWNTSTIADGDYYLKVVANCSQGLISSYTLEESFTIDNTHTLSEPTITYPNGGEVLNETIVIQWNTAVDSHSHSVSYTVYYSNDDRVTWTEIATLSSTSYSWNTEAVSNGNYWIKVVAECSEGRVSEDVTDTAFTINNIGSTSHTLLTPIITYPTGGETVRGTINIQWTAAIDSHGHSVTYELFYIHSAYDSWALFASDITSNSYSWDTTGFGDGYYWIKVIATCSAGTSAESSPTEAFLIDNVYERLGTPYLVYPTGGETLTGSVTVSWTQVYDLDGHNVTYELFIAEDGNSANPNWIKLLWKTDTTNYELDTSNYSDGTTYKLMVIAWTDDGYMVDASSGIFSIQNEGEGSTTGRTTFSTPYAPLCIVGIAILTIGWFKKRRN